VPPLIGRIFNITSDILEKATEELAKTFFISPGRKNKKILQSIYFLFEFFF